MPRRPAPTPPRPSLAAEPVAARRALLWLAPEQSEFALAVARAAGLDPIAAGVSAPSPAASAGPTRAFAERAGAAPQDDLRRALLTCDADVALIAGASPAESALLDDSEVLRAVAARSLRVIVMLPTPASVRDLPRPGSHAGAPAVRPIFVPLMRRAPGFRAAAEATLNFGAPSTLSLCCLSGSGHGSIAARALDAMDFILATFGSPETIDASVRGPRSESGLRLAAGDSLRDLRGDLTAHLRYPEGRSAAILLSDRAGRWFRGATMLGEGGRIVVEDHGFEWLSPAGDIVDSSSRRPARRAVEDGAAPASEPARLIGEEIVRLLDPRLPPEPPADAATALAVAEAALLSARTGQPESPATILRMAGAF